MCNYQISLQDERAQLRSYLKQFPGDAGYLAGAALKRGRRAIASGMSWQPPASGRKDLGFPVRDLVKVVTYVRRRPQKVVHPTPAEVARGQMFALELTHLASQLAEASLGMAATLAPAIEPKRSATV